MESRKPFAFISYSRKDVKVATDIRERLDKYVYSHELVKPENRPEDNRYVRPIYQDLTDLHTREPNFWEDLKGKVKDARYLIVICSPNSAESKAVREGVEYFLSTHNDDANLIVPVLIDGYTSMQKIKIIDKIIKVRNCPNYITSRDKEGHMGRKYCFYHLLEYLLHVDFYKLYNRYEIYKKKKRAKKMAVVATIVGAIFLASIYGWISNYRVAEKEKQRATTAEALTKFERKTFPYSLVVGYVNNFLRPTLEALNEREGEKAHIIIYMPYSYEQLDIKANTEHLNQVFLSDSLFAGFHSEEIAVKERKRGVALVRANLKDLHVPIYIDVANTVVAFKYVVDYKFNSKENPLKVDDTVENRDQMVREYTDEFILHTLQDMNKYAEQIHFVKSEDELRNIIKVIIYKKEK